MTTYDYIETTSDQHYGAGFPMAGGSKYFVLKRTFNTATALTDVGASAWVAEDVVKLIDIPAETLVMAVKVQVTTAESTASAHLDIGDGDDIDGWEAAIDMDASPLPHICSLTNANGGTVTDRDNGYYASADTIDAILGAAVWTDAVFDIAVVCVDLS